MIRALLLSLLLFLPAHSASPPARDWTRFGWDIQRSSAPDGSMGLTPATLDRLQRHQIQLEGTVDASPIFLSGVQVGGRARDVLVVTTTYGKTQAIDAGSDSVLWTYTPPGFDDWAGTYRITNASPLADPDRQHIYAAAPDGKIRKLALADGHEVWSTAITRLPQREKIAASLNFSGGHVLATTGGYIGDRPPYQGHVAVLDAGSGRIINVWNSLCSDRAGLLTPSDCRESGSAIWGRSGAVVDSATGNIFVATGDGRWDGRTYWGDAVLELDPTASRLLGNWTPEDTHRLDDDDVDLGSTAPVLLGNGLVAQGGKGGKIPLLDWSQERGTTPHQGKELQSVSTPGGDRLFSAPAVWRHEGKTWLFVADGRGTAAWTVSGKRLEPAWQNGNSGTSPVVVDGMLLVYDPAGHLRIYDAARGRLLKTLDCGGGHWNSPIAVKGMIVLTEGNANRHETSGIMDIWR